MKCTRSPLRPALFYLVFASAWVIFSDELLLHMGMDTATLIKYQQSKGVVFVIVTSILLAFALYRHHRQQQHKQQAHRLDQERLTLALESAQEGLWDWDLRNDRAYFSERYCQMLGFDQETFGNRLEDWESRMHPDDLNMVRHLVEAHLSEGGPKRYETSYRIRHSDGNYRWVRARGRLLRDEQGNLLRFIGTSLDITDSRADQEKLRQASAVFDCTREGVLITDAQRRIVHINQAFVSITGYSAEEALGHDPRLFKSGRHEPAFYQAIWHTVNSTDAWSGEIWNRRKNGETFPLWQSIRAVRDENGLLTHYVAVFSDISAIKSSQQELAFLAHHDPLCGLPNRLLFSERLQQAIQQAQRLGRSGALLLLDLDHFKHINESLGHSVGDQLLKMSGERLRRLLPAHMTLARLGGDEFAVIVPHADKAETVSRLAEQLLSAFREPFEIAGETLFAAGSIGISQFPVDGDSLELLLSNADSALFRAKASGRQTFSFYSQEMTALARQRVRLDAELRQALAQGELRVHYQPIHRLDDRRILGFEALVRWEHPQRGLVPPGEFIPFAEESGLIGEIDAWVLRQACAQMQIWRGEGRALEFVAVNVSSRLFIRGELDRQVAEVLARSGLPADCLELEITESAVMEDPQGAQELLERLRALGVRLAIDDFGTGYSSLARLKRLPVHKLKIDQSFVAGLPGQAGDTAIVQAVVMLGRNLGLRVLAEGIENEEQAESLLQKGCLLGQGYWFGRPQPPDKLFPPSTEAAAQAGGDATGK